MVFRVALFMIASVLGGSDGMLEVTARIARHSKEEVLIVVNVNNRSGAETATDVRVTLVSGRQVIKELPLGPLGSNQRVGFHETLPPDSGAVIARVSYTYKNVVSSVERVADGGPNEGMHWQVADSLPALLGLLGVLVGAGLMHLSNTFRERSRSQFEWGKLLFDEYSAAYRHFLNSWGSASNASILLNCYTELTKEAFVPRRIETAFRDTMAVLESPGASDEEKREICARLKAAVTSLMFRPWSEVE